MTAKTPAERQQDRRDEIKKQGKKWVRLLVHKSWEPYLKDEIEPECQEPFKDRARKQLAKWKKENE